MEYKRKQRAMSDITKQKISAKLKGRKKPISVCTKISQSLQNYWSQIPTQNDDSDIINNGL